MGDAVTLTEIPALQQMGVPVLSILIFLPLAAALLLRLIQDSKTAYTIGLGVSIAELALALLVWLRFIPNVSDMQFVEHLPLIPALGFSYHLGVDGISVLFLPATALLGVLAVLYAETSSREDAGGYLSAMLMFEGIMIGAFVSLDLLMFLFWFVAELCPSWLLVTRWGTGEKRFEAARALCHHDARGIRSDAGRHDHACYQLCQCHRQRSDFRLRETPQRGNPRAGPSHDVLSDLHRPCC